MRGLFLAEPEIIKLMDAEVISEPDLLPVQLNKDGSLRKNAPAVNRQQMQALLNLAQQRAADLARSILSGRVQISPYYRGRDTGCNFCPYRAVCSFDRQIPGVTYRHLKAIKGDFWQLVPAALKKEDD